MFTISFDAANETKHFSNLNTCSSTAMNIVPSDKMKIKKAFKLLIKLVGKYKSQELKSDMRWSTTIFSQGKVVCFTYWGSLSSWTSLDAPFYLWSS